MDSFFDVYYKYEDIQGKDFLDLINEMKNKLENFLEKIKKEKMNKKVITKEEQDKIN